MLGKTPGWRKPWLWYPMMGPSNAERRGPCAQRQPGHGIGTSPKCGRGNLSIALVPNQTTTSHANLSASFTGKDPSVTQLQVNLLCALG